MMSLLLLAQAATAVPATTDYPTTAVADYVIGCMAANGQTYDAMQRCSCSINVIASILPYDDYEKAETVMRMRDESGERASIFREVRMMTNAVRKLREAQVESDFRCF